MCPKVTEMDPKPIETVGQTNTTDYMYLEVTHMDPKPLETTGKTDTTDYMYPEVTQMHPKPLVTAGPDTSNALMACRDVTPLMFDFFSSCRLFLLKKIKNQEFGWQVS